MFFFPRRIAFSSTLFIFLFSPLLPAQSDSQHSARVEAIRFWSFGDVTRVAIETSGDYKLYSEQIDKPARVFFDLTGLEPPSAARNSMEIIPVNDHRIRQIRVARLNGNKTRIVFDLEMLVEVVSSQLVNPDRLMIEIRPRGTSLPALNDAKTITGSHRIDLADRSTTVDKDIADTEPIIDARPVSTTLSSKSWVARNSAPKDDPDDAYHPHRQANSAAASSLAYPRPPIATEATPPRDQTLVLTQPRELPNPMSVSAAKTDSAGDRSLVRVFGLKLGRVVIDAGHGGHDSGTIGPNGLMEKDLVLDVALRLGALIKKQMGAEVIYTRSTDVFIPLEERTRIANEQKADLFISIHANSSPEPAASGVETYYFNLTSDKSGLDLATRENASSDSSISDLNDLLHRAVLQTKREESREFAQLVQASLTAASSRSPSSQVRDRGVRQAPFVVLIGANMPSILAEIGFVSNPRDERLLRRSDQRARIAEALFKGIQQYSNSLSHVQMARAGEE